MMILVPMRNKILTKARRNKMKCILAPKNLTVAQCSVLELAPKFMVPGTRRLILFPKLYLRVKMSRQN